MMKALHFKIYYQLDVELLKIIERDDSDKNYPHRIALLTYTILLCSRLFVNTYLTF